MAWRTSDQGTANNQSWTYHHDEWRTGRYGVDSPAAGSDPQRLAARTRLSFVAPLDDW